MKIGTLIIFIFFISLNFGWLRRETEVTLARMALINEARLLNQDEVIIPAYDEIGKFSLFSYTNNHHQKFDTPYSIKFYGTRLIVEGIE
jgi:hypothetical protein